MQKEHIMKKKMPLALSLVVLLCLLFFSCPVKRSLFSSYLPIQNFETEQSLFPENETAFANCGDCAYIHQETEKPVVLSERTGGFSPGFVPVYAGIAFQPFYVNTVTQKTPSSTFRRVYIPLFLQNQSFLI